MAKPAHGELERWRRGSLHGTRWVAVGAAALMLLSLSCLALASSAPATSAQSPPVVPRVSLKFPVDYGSHPQFGIEWWYVTGWLTTAQRQPLGFQITFFRVKTATDPANPSDFAAHQLLIAHCALSDPAHGRLWQEQRVRRAGLGLVGAAVGDTQVRIDDWQLQRRAERGDPDVYEARLQATDFALELTLTASTAPMLNGDAGFSQKGPSLHSASYYYSQPHLQVKGSVLRSGQRTAVQGEAWLDHEWASEYLDPNAEGWDWVGLNLEDGGAVMAFEIRDRHGRAYWAGGTLRDARGRVQTLGPADIHFEPLRYWRSPRSGVRYPVVERVSIGPRQFVVRPLMDDQEFDARLSSGALYWEGAVTASDARQALAGRGYLELTGYDRPLSLR